MKPITDDKIFSEAKSTFLDLKTLAGTRNQLYDRFKNAYLLRWEDKPDHRDGLKMTISPSARNAVLGITRLLAGAGPIISVTDVSQDIPASEIEGLLGLAWDYSGKTAGVKLHFDAALSAVLYGKVHLTVMLTSELVKMAAGTSKANLRRVEKIADSTPVLFRVLDPYKAYEDRDEFGLSAYGREEAMFLGDVRRLYGKGASSLTGDDGDAVTLYDLWDLEKHFVWVDGNDKPVIAEEHELVAIPVATAMADGTRLFEDEDEQIQPFLYTLIESGLWNRQNLALTVASTNLFDFGGTPPLVYNRSGNNTLKANLDGVVPHFEVDPGESVTATGLAAVSPEVWKYKEVIDQMVEASTIYGQTLGQPLGSNATFSATAMLSRSGQLPLQGPRDAVGAAAAEIFDIALDWMADEGVTHELLDGIDLKADRQVEVKLDVKMPADTARNIQLVQQLSSAPSPVVSDDWMLENLLQITDPDEMRKAVTRQIAYKARTMQRVQGMLQKMNQPQQPAQPQQPGQGGPMHQMPDGSMMPGATHEEAMAQGMPGPDGSMGEAMPPRGEQGLMEAGDGSQG